VTEQVDVRFVRDLARCRKLRIGVGELVEVLGEDRSRARQDEFERVDGLRSLELALRRGPGKKPAAISSRSFTSSAGRVAPPESAEVKP
jgi:hypothetical protein